MNQPNDEKHPAKPDFLASKGVWTSSENAKLTPVLHAWIQCLDLYRYDRDVHRPEDSTDEPWHYRERTQIGFLSAACWRCNIPTLEEWGTEKSKDGNWINQDPRSKGRGDLWIGGEIDLHIEAKHRWLSLTAQNVSGRSLVGSIAMAVRDLEKLDPVLNRAAAVFFSIHTARRGSSRNYSCWLQSLLELRPSYLAWNLTGSTTQSDDLGIALALFPAGWHQPGSDVGP